MNLTPKGRNPFGQRQESRPLARANTGSPRITDFPSSVHAQSQVWQILLVLVSIYMYCVYKAI